MLKISDTNSKKNPPLNKRITILYLFVSAIIWVVYIYLLLTAPVSVSQERFGINLTQLRLIQFTVVVPLLLTWLAGVYAGGRLTAYSIYLGGSKEARPINALAQGVYILSLGLIVNSVISSLRTRFQADPSLLETFTIMMHYMNLLFTQLGLWSFARGARSLAVTIPDGELPRSKKLVGGIIIFGLAIMMIFITFTNPSRRVATVPGQLPQYMLPDVAIAFTIVLPQIVNWGLAIFAALYISKYAGAVTGSIYQKSFKALSRGLILLLVFYISLQVLSYFSAYFATAALVPILLVVYAILALMALSYGFMAYGASKLSKIETV